MGVNTLEKAGMHRMRIAQIVSTFPPYMAGTGNVCLHNSLELAKLGHDVTVFTSKYPDEDYQYPDSIKVVRFKPFFRIGNAPFMPQLMKLPKFDIVHLHYPFVFGAELVLLNSLVKRNVFVITYHQDLLFKGFLRYLVEGYNEVMGNLVLSKARKILAPSLDYLASSSVKHMMRRRKRDIIELPNGVDTDRFKPGIDCNEIRSNYKLDDKKVVLFVGALDKAHLHRRVDILIQAFSKIDNQKTVLIIVGEGGLKQYFQNLARDSGIWDKVIFTGRILNEDLPRYYALCDLLVLPSTRVEIFGLVLVEAMACGRPVIASNLPGVRTVVDNSKNGFLVNPGDIDELASKIQYLLEHKDLREEFGKEGRKKVEAKYSWSQIGRQLETTYQAVLGNK